MGEGSITGPDSIRNTSGKVGLIRLRASRRVRDTQEGGYSRVPVGFAAKVISC